MATASDITGPSARVSARLLAALHPLIDHARRHERGRWPNGSLMIESAPGGGALMIALTGHAVAVLRDPKGACSGPMTVDLPDEFLEACARPDVRVMADIDGECVVSLPEWLVPGVAHLMPLMAVVHARMPPPVAMSDGDRWPALASLMGTDGPRPWGEFRVTAGPPAPNVSWRRTFKAWRRDRAAFTSLIDEPLSHDPWCFNPEVPARLAAVVAALPRDLSLERVVHTPTGTFGGRQVLLALDGFADFIGIYAMQTPGDVTAAGLPDWLGVDGEGG